MISRKFPKFLFGGDYNPEQFPKEIGEEDMRLFQLAGIDIATLNVFSWSLNQPDEET
ncbi:beta-galactosidase, partial [Paenibacillus sp. TAF58]